MRRFLLVACVALAMCPVWGQQTSNPSVQPPTTEQVMKFFEVMHVREQMQTLLQNQQKQVNIMVTDTFNKRLPDATPDQRKQFESIMSDMIGGLVKDYPVDDILRDMVPVYQNHLSESDLSAIVAFYSSPVGKKILREMPAMTAEGMRVSYSRLQPKIEEVTRKMESRIDAMVTNEKEKATSKEK